MNMCWKAALTLALVGMSISGANVVAETKKSLPQAKPVDDVLPKAATSPQLEALKKQLSGVMVFRDPTTGELRPPHSTRAYSSQR
jgi:hypothetical protein